MLNVQGVDALPLHDDSAQILERHYRPVIEQHFDDRRLALAERLPPFSCVSGMSATERSDTSSEIQGRLAQAPHLAVESTDRAEQMTLLPEPVPRTLEVLSAASRAARASRFTARTMLPSRDSPATHVRSRANAQEPAPATSSS